MIKDRFGVPVGYLEGKKKRKYSSTSFPLFNLKNHYEQSLPSEGLEIN